MEKYVITLINEWKGEIMNRSDKIFISIVLLVTIGLFFSTSNIAKAINVEDSQAVFTYKDKEIRRIDMTENGLYTIQGELGDVVVEIKDGQIRIAEEISPRNYCSLQGWVSKSNTPIVCLPNKVVVIIESTHNGVEDQDEDIIIR